MMKYEIARAEEEVLRSLIGGTLVSFEASPMGHNEYYEKIMLNMTDDSVVISNSFEAVDVGYESGSAVEEAGVLHVRFADAPLVLDDIEFGPDNVTAQVNSTIEGIEVINDEIRMYRGDSVSNAFTFTQAIIFHLKMGDFVIDRGVWFEVFLNAYTVARGEARLRDTKADWEYDEGEGLPYRGEVTRTVYAVR